MKFISRPGVLSCLRVLQYCFCFFIFLVYIESVFFLSLFFTTLNNLSNCKHEWFPIRENQAIKRDYLWFICAYSSLSASVCVSLSGNSSKESATQTRKPPCSCGAAKYTSRMLCPHCLPSEQVERVKIYWEVAWEENYILNAVLWNALTPFPYVKSRGLSAL